MDEQIERPTRRELMIAVVAGAILALLETAMAHGAQSLPAPSPWRGGLGRGEAARVVNPSHFNHPSLTLPIQGREPENQSVPVAASCRVLNRLPDGPTNIGSGTLVDVAADGRRGLVLSCAHLFTEGTGQVVVEFRDGRTHGALVARIDRQADLAALEIANPREAPAAINFELAPSARLTACGFGPDGQYRSIAGPVIGMAERPGQSSLQMAGAVRSGDSGGGVFDDSGRLVAVVWGESGGVTYASTGAPLARFVEGALGGRQAVAYSQACAMPVCPNGRCPLAPRPIVTGPVFNAAPPPVVPAAPSAAQLADLTRRLDELDQKKQDRGDYLRRGELTGYVRAQQLADLETQSQQRHKSLLGRLDDLAPAAAGRAAGMLTTTALGVSGPMGWGIVAGTSIGGWLVGRWLRRRGERRGSRGENGSRSDSLAPRSSALAPPPEATAAADGSFPATPQNAEQEIDHRAPIERDDREARELLRLSQLEGRDPLQDALAGRLALDRLDALAECDPDAPQAAWADELRRELRDRFNEIAPTKFQTSFQRSAISSQPEDSERVSLPSG